MHPILTAFLSQTADGGAGGGGGAMAFLPFIAIAVVFYLVFFRPQAKQQKQHQKFLQELQKGVEVVTSGGVIGRVVQVEDRTVILDIGGGTKSRVVKANIAGAWVEKPAAAEPAKVEAKK